MQPDLNRSFKVQELTLHYSHPYESPVTITTSDHVFAFLAPLIAHKPREHLVRLSLASNNDLAGLEYVSIGTANSASASPAEIFKAILLTNATAFILAHNHPSGKPDPSDNDRDIAYMVNKAAEILGIRMLDFIIITDAHYYSFENKDPLWRTRGDR